MAAVNGEPSLFCVSEGGWGPAGSAGGVKVLGGFAGAGLCAHKMHGQTGLDG